MVVLHYALHWHILSISILITTLSVVISGIIIFLCCWWRKDSEYNSLLRDNSINDGGHLSASYQSLEATEAAVPIAISPPLTINSGYNSSSNSSPKPGNDYSSPQHSSDRLSSDKQPANSHGETKDMDDVEDLVKSFFIDTEVHKQRKKLPDLGSRLEKYWFLQYTTPQLLLFVVKVSTVCPLELQKKEILDGLRVLFENLNLHPYLLKIHGIECKNGYISIIEEFVQEGSLRDALHQARSPTMDWCDKYTETGEHVRMKARDIAACGRHILEAMVALYEAGFPIIGQIHTGNVFKVSGNYVVGGYENTLLGYRGSSYKDIAGKGLLARMDMIMFGHLIYELATGVPLKYVVPEKDYKFEEVAHKPIKNVLQFIFKAKWKDTNIKSIEQIRRHKFFQSELIEVVKVPLNISQAGNQVLRIVNSGTCSTTKPLDQCEFQGLNAKALMTCLSSDYSDVKLIERIGSNIGKVWATATHKDRGTGLLCAATIPSTCPIFVKTSINGLKSFFAAAEHNGHIHAIWDILYAKVDGRHVVVFFQSLRKRSLKDCIHQCDKPLQAWEKKYHNPMPLENSQIALYGFQILHAMIFLKVQELPPLQHVHSGNIFIDGDRCFLGGLESTLLGYLSESFKCHQYPQSIDVLMFGHVIYEMTTGKILKEILPTADDIKDLHSDLHDLLRFIFQVVANRSELLHSLDEIISHKFFKEHNANFAVHTDPCLTMDTKLLLQDVRKGKCRNQDNTFSSMRRTLKQNMFRTFSTKK